MILTGSWEKVVDEAPFSPRDTSEGVVFDGKMWLSNAYYHGGILTRDLWSTPDGAVWTEVSNATPYNGYSEMVVFDGRLWAVKGSIWCSIDGEAWEEVLSETPFGSRGYGELAIHDGKMWQLGSGNDVWSSSDGLNWALVADDLPYGARSGVAVTVFQKKLWVMGGRHVHARNPLEKGYPNYTTLNDVWCSKNGISWTRVIEHAPWCPRMWFKAEAYAGRLWIIGGYDNIRYRNLPGMWSTEDGLTWEEFEPVGEAWDARHEPTCYIFDDSLWVVAGNTWPVVNDVWRLTL